MPRENFATTVERWRKIADGMARHEIDIPYLAEHRARLEEMIARANELIAQRAVHQAAKQQATRDLQALLADGRRVASFLRAGLIQELGNRSSRLIAFGLRPFSRRSRRSAEAPAQDSQG